MTHSRDKSGIQRHAEFFRQKIGIERTACKELAIEVKRRHFAPSVIYAQHQVFRVRRFVNVNFLELNAALLQELLGAPAVRAPLRAVDAYGSHEYPQL